MKLLFLSPFVPWPLGDGGRVRVYHLLKAAARRHDVQLLALGTDATASAGAAALRAEGLEVDVVPHCVSRLRAALPALARGRSLYHEIFYSRSFGKEVRERLGRLRYDAVQCEYAYMAQYAITDSRTRWILDEHNLEFRITQRTAAALGSVPSVYSLYAAREWRLRRKEELAACRRMDLVLTVSDADRNALQAAASDVAAAVIPNGVDLTYYSPSHPEIDCDRPAVVFVGDMRYRPNSDAVVWFCREIWPRILHEVPTATFTVVGQIGQDVRSVEATPNVRFTGWVKDTRPYVRDGTVAVVPLRAGSGTRLKVLECLAMQTPVVSTPMGHEGLDLIPGRHLVSADGAEAFAKETVALLGNAGKRRELGKCGRQLVESQYSWSSITERLESSYQALLVDGPRRLAV